MWGRWGGGYWMARRKEGEKMEKKFGATVIV